MPDINDELRLGVGTGRLRDRRDCFETVKSAIEQGYRHIDTARHYRNERAIGDALDEVDVERDKLFVSTKIHSRNLSRQDLRDSVEKSRQRLGLEQIDLVYVHWPAHSYEPSETLPALEELRDEGVVRHIGLSNFTPTQITEAESILDAPIFAIQAEMHPFLQQQELREFAATNDYWLVAHSPLCGGDVTDNTALEKIAERHGCSAAQVSLAWVLSHDGTAAVPGAKSQYLEHNRRALSVELTDRDRETIAAIGMERRMVDYSFAPWRSE